MKPKGHRVVIYFSLILGFAALFGLYKFFNKQSAQTDFLVMGTEAGFEPFDYLKDGQVVGFDVDLAQEIAKDMGKTLKIENMAFDGLLAALKAGRVDMVVAGMSITEDRKKSVAFSEPYYQAAQVIIVPKNSPIRQKQDLKGCRIGVQLGTTGDQIVDQIEAAVKVQFPAVPAVLQELSNGRIDAVVLDNAPAKKYLVNRPNLIILDDKLSDESYAIALRQDSSALLKQINQTLARVKRDGSYDRLLDKYFANLAQPERATWHTIFLQDRRYMMLIEGLGVTLLLALLASLGGLLFGVLAILGRISHFYPFRFLAGQSKLVQFNPLSSLAKLYTTIIRGTPLLVQLLIFYYVVFGHYQTVPKILIAALAFALNSGAYVAEILRSGFESLPKGQWEAAESLGFSYIKTIRYITMPQVFKMSLPSLMNEFVALIKETSVVGWIGLSDLMRGADNIRFQTATAFEALLVVALIYLILTSVATHLAGRVERKLKVSD